MHEPAVLVDVFAVHAFAVEPKALVDSDRARVVFEHVERDFVQAQRPESIAERGPHRLRPIAFRPERRFADYDPHVRLPVDPVDLVQPDVPDVEALCLAREDLFARPPLVVTEPSFLVRSVPGPGPSAQVDTLLARGP